MEKSTKMEKVMELGIKLDKGAYMPIREHSTDAGLDIRTKEEKIILPNHAEIFHTGVHIKLPPNTAGLLVSKSGLNVKHDITSTGLIDEGYSGEIIIKLYNHGFNTYKVKAGDKISQLVIVPVMYCKIKVISKLRQHSERGDKGFGSTGR